MLANVFTKSIQDRAKGMAIGVATLAGLLVMGMAVYRDIDLSVYTSLPEAYRSLFNIPEGVDIGGLAYGAIYSSYGALIMASIAVSIGAGAIAAEERNGTMGLLLANPRSRTSVLASKAEALVALAALGSLGLWAAAWLTPIILNVNVGGLDVAALLVHLFVNTVFYGFLALAIGAATGSKGMASGVSAGLMVVSFFAVGLLPLVKGFEGLAKAFPWYYFTGSDPLNNGISWNHLGVLVAGCVVFAIAAVIGVNRRDLRSQTVGVALIDRLRSNPLTKQVANRLAGSTRVSRIWIKTVSEHQGLTFVTASLMFFIMGVMIGPMYALLDKTLIDLSGMIPDTMLALFGGGDLSTPEGWYQIETFGMMAPIAVMVVTIAMGARDTAGEEEHRTMGLLLANPVSRGRVLMEKAAAMVILGAVVGVSIFAGVTVGSLLGGLGMSIAHIAATSLLATLVGLVFGALALTLSAAFGSVKVATFGAVGAGLVLYVANALLSLNDRLAAWAGWSPFHYYLGSDPLQSGMSWGNGAVLALSAALLMGGAVVLFQRRDLRQRG